MTTYAKISQVAHYLPPQVVTNDDLSKIMDTSDDWIASRTGIRRRRIAKDQQTSDLASRVAENLLEKAALSADQIDFIIVATITPDSTMPSTAARVQAAIGAKHAFAYDLSAACSGFVFALSMAEKLIASGAYRKGMVIGAEVLSKIIDWENRSTAVLFGDGAGGVLLEADDQPHFLAESLGTDGARGHGLQSGKTGLQSPYSETSDHNLYLRMDGRAIFDFAIRDVTKSIIGLLEKEAMEVEDVDYFLLHQANVRILEKMAKKLGVSNQKFPTNVANYGNTSAATIPILLSECVEDGLIQLDGGQTILLSGFGGGLTWGTLIIQL
ncbi:ketoacyl-ACP synthase III [Streptococcus sp. X16XC17]|uniref:beta-ketoacyl-ACP synthase III n=1 Tax=unclassified Streptococcus TaxID=2608887 RepID=UPI00066FFC6D|nr:MULTISPECIES: beta-ketoacyl-ACP synthase III [unclassified Streptococcus]TCD45685.1 ketoacyl-ACP synthase III [Streptococcus sp. X16XC17]